MNTYEMRPSGEKGFEQNTTEPFYSTGRNRSDNAFQQDPNALHSGTEADAQDMARLGRSQELRRNFKSLSVLGLSVTTMATWSALLLTNFFVMVNGGLAGAVWTYLASWICTFALAASLAEMASMAPTSGGQYHWWWVSEFAPHSQSRFLSYVTGWLAALGWQALIAATAYSAAVLTLAMAAIYHTV
ncbi:hypothetical protein LTR62_000201 [Meristemomyces frigidus]|uniref:Uncharacterized protein n=1 Tax=Meristemomyces frigidus TaxID=1508187 RepID=A0AAN7YK42_9PEZI|nr:hypothetical protein LTR62_000201 [Meristemomyces frigidus]